MKAAFLLLAACLFTASLANAAPKIGVAADARLWLQVPADSPPVTVQTSAGAAGPAGWLGTPAENERLTDITFPITTGGWTEATVSFTPAKDTSVTLSLLGPWDQSGTQTEVLYDKLAIEGATLLNADFEQISGENFASWKSDAIPFKTWPLADATPLSGKHLAAAWNNRTMSQSFAVKGGTRVTLTVHAMAASIPGMEAMVKLGSDTPAHAAARKIKRGVNFGNRWEVPPPFSWQIPYSVEDVRLAAAQGFDHIRIPIAWHHYLTTKAGKTGISPALLGEIEPLIDLALKLKLHVIIDWHHYDALTSDPDAFQQRFVDGWKAIATHFKSRSPELFLELLNEPKDAMTTSRLNLLNAHTLEAIRRIDPTRIILVTCGEWSSVKELEKLRLPADDDRLIVTLHNYDPFFFTHQGANWTGMTALKGVHYPGPPEAPLAVPDSLKNRGDIVKFIKDYNTLPAEQNPCSSAIAKELLAKAAAWSEKYGRPVHLGEFGVVTTAELKDRIKYVRDVRTLAESHGIPWTLWDWKAGFAYWDKEANTPLLREAIFGK